MAVTAYQQAQQEGQEAVRAAILDAAVHLLVTEGPAALTVRRISGEAGCSTKVIYTLFGGKDGLSEALWLEGFARFERRLLAVPAQDDPLASLRAGLEAYRDYALAEPDYYRVMFQSAMPGFCAGPEAVMAAKRTFELLVRGVRACLEQGLLRGGTAEEIADLLWMAIHGAVSLEITGFYHQAEAAQRCRALCSSVLTPFLLPADRTPDERTEP
ncbi:TetR/AcrR family transcriptional regulator [Nonomuraea basaltis]|uniref:TetR/AcrR family transcriptional regulator n=1 Tax=Nonomuraea basaltis TaxID=2495887 RepID=UPI00110C6790|nr:TetR/AcrR family transcriptional regulator [Nonomuraea basaltis]TMR98122.1 TetR/AcrR family transcriptional regulator [Nonomuraea basaltis]